MNEEVLTELDLKLQSAVARMRQLTQELDEAEELLRRSNERVLLSQGNLAGKEEIFLSGSTILVCSQ